LACFGATVARDGGVVFVAERNRIMLILTRKIGETVVLPSIGVSVTVMRVRGQGVRLGITAPVEIQIQREEIAIASPFPRQKEERP
jgi:carbon storage regulator CsrA